MNQPYSDSAKCVLKYRRLLKARYWRHRKLEEVAKHETLPEHANCVRFLKAWEEKQHLYIQTELCKTSLNVYAEENHSIPEKVIWNYLVDLLMAVRHLHEHDLVHMDIKPENIFISDNNVCKLGDFGLVIDLNKDIEMSDAQEGDPKYLAPELMKGQFGKPADIFSLGITILELASDLDLPRGGDLWHQLRSGHLPEEFLSGISHELKDVIRWMMEPDPERRPTVQQVLEHESVQKEAEASIVHVHAGTPPRAVTLHKHPPEWDHSFSDDDVLELGGDCSISNNSLGMPLLDTSSGSDDSFRQRSCSAGGYILPSLIRSKNAHSPRSSVHQNAPECGLFDSATTFYSSSPVSCTFNGLSSSHEIAKLATSPGMSVHDSCLMDVTDEHTIPAAMEKIVAQDLCPDLPCHTVEPKNLMKVFENTLSEDEHD